MNIFRVTIGNYKTKKIIDVFNGIVVLNSFPGFIHFDEVDFMGEKTGVTRIVDKKMLHRLTPLKMKYGFLEAA